MTTPLPAVRIMRNLHLEPDPWQIEALESTHPRLLLNCCRQAGKSTTVAILGLTTALFVAGSRVILLSRSHRQSRELFRTVMSFFRRFQNIPKPTKRTTEEVEFVNGSRIVCVPCKEDTIRGYANVGLLIIDEAARVPDDIYRAVNPMLAVSQGRLIALSTPYGKRGFFHHAWSRGGDTWQRIEVAASSIPRISPEFLESQRTELGEAWYRQEYCCSFEALEGLVYPDFARCVVTGEAPAGKKVGGIDFGFRNPFAAIWGVVDRDGVLWLTGEHYARQQPLSHHAQRMPKDVLWYADPAGASEIAELTYANFKVWAGENALRPGIAAVTARLQAGTLKVLAGKCPNLVGEAELYRYGDAASTGGAETPIDDHNHALAALRYLISMLDRHKMARGLAAAPKPAPTEAKPPPAKEPWLSVNNEALFGKPIQIPRDPRTGEFIWPEVWSNLR